MVQDGTNDVTTLLTMDHEDPVVHGIASGLLPVEVCWDNIRKVSRCSLNVCRMEIDHGLWHEFLHMHVKCWLLFFLLFLLLPYKLWHGHWLLLNFLAQCTLLSLEGFL